MAIDMLVNCKQNTCKTQVKQRWNTGELKKTGAELQVACKWKAHEMQEKKLWNISEMHVTSKWNEGEMQVKYMQHTCEIQVQC